MKNTLLHQFKHHIPAVPVPPASSPLHSRMAFCHEESAWSGRRLISGSTLFQSLNRGAD